eukprot:TRINITY_DN3818_c0_g1_i1.p3 TRINITY_DN3818_c0_g1~~TRINITY_DN3818_c0_g1_i1.p3  ORF type:complete len:163 (-),score=60.72 TRINITY_DN3818_c0_g1_i1:54-542(-)
MDMVVGHGYVGLGYGYAGLGHLGYGYGLHGLGYAGHYYGKREAEATPEAAPEAEADPALLYGAYGYAGLGHYGYAGLGHYGYAGLGHLGYGYGLHGLGYSHYYGKREAEAAPEAEADPVLLYGAYGYPYAGLGHYGYAGLGHYGYAGLGHYGYGAYYGKRSA